VAANQSQNWLKWGRERAWRFVEAFVMERIARGRGVRHVETT
jgi:hypothetical protein